MSGRKYSLTKLPTTAAEAQKKQDGRRWKGVWYVRWKRVDGSYSSKKSTGHTNKSDAIDWCEKKLARGVPRLNADVRLTDYAAGFFDWPDGRYARDRLAGGYRVSYRSAQAHRLNVENHLSRLLGSVKMQDIDRRITRKIRDTLYAEKRSPSTINHIVNTLSVLLQAAEEDAIIAAVPRIYRAGGQRKKRGSLSLGEARTLFTDGEWRDPRDRMASLIAAATGLRQSEILGLTRDRVHRDYIDVRRSWDRNEYRLHDTTKNERPRVVPIARTLRREIAEVISAYPHPGVPREERFVFYHDSNPREPYDGHNVTKGLYHALVTIGILEDERAERNIVFHSWRHFANSQLVEAGVPTITVQAMIGHQSNDMTLNYYQADDLTRIAAVQSVITDVKQSV